jgi:streptogramin lyase
VCAGLVEEGVERVGRGFAVDLLLDVLGLASGAGRRHHDPPCDPDRHVHAVVELHEVQTEVDARGGYGVSMENPVCVCTGVRPAATTSNSYQGSTMSLRSTPNTSREARQGRAVPRLRLAAVLVVIAALGATSAFAAPAGRLPGAKAFTTFAAAGPYWPTETLAIDRTTAWIACKEQQRVIRFDTARGKLVRSLRLGGSPIAVVSGFGSVWALDTGGTLYRIGTASLRVTKRIPLAARAPYNLWIGAGSVWAIDDGSGELIRVSPATNRVVARVVVGDGPADMVFAGTSAWVVNHRDKGLVRVDTRTNTYRRLATLDSADAPERITRLAGSLWITGRGTDLLQVDPDTGEVKQVVEIGGSGIDVVAAGGYLWLPTRSVAVDPTGFPTMEALRRVAPAGTVKTVAKSVGRLDVHGLAPGVKTVWLADNTGGMVYRVPA